MEVLSLVGGLPLAGVIPVHGAKNSVLPILAACTLCGGPCVLHNCPHIRDVEATLSILSHLGCWVGRSGEDLLVDAGPLTGCTVPYDLACRMRSSILFLGALAARKGQADIALPGGCPLGARPIDLHLMALRQMGAEMLLTKKGVTCRADRLKGAHITLPFPSVGATENALLAAVAADGQVRISGAALEPEITDLIGFLTAAGAEITGAGTSELTIIGGRSLHGTEYTVMPDRIETATYLCAAAACGGDVTVTNTAPETLLPVLEVLERAGCAILQGTDTIRLCAQERLYAPGEIITGPYPAFPTDAQALVMAALLRAEGETVFRETIFENRLHHVYQLQKLGADIRISGQNALVRGVGQLHGADLTAGDLRGGAAMAAAALSAEGKSAIFGVKHIKRGYDNLDGKLQRLGAQINYVEI